MRQLANSLVLVLLLQSVPVPVLAQSSTNFELPTSSIDRVVKAGFMTRSADGNFYPERSLSRAELASILVRVFDLEKRSPATQDTVAVQDVPRSHWAYDDIQTVLKTRVMQGYRGGQFYPNQKITRAEAFAIFAQAYGVFQFPDNTVNAILSDYPDATQVPDWARKAIATALSEGFINTDVDNNIYPLQLITRGDLAFALNRYLERQQNPNIPF